MFAKRNGLAYCALIARDCENSFSYLLKLLGSY
jgi:hypothetical protein